MSAMLDAALAYARRGIPIFPCIPNSKKPATARGFHDATTDETAIRSWWQSGPDFNIAFSPQTIGQGVVDLDGQDGIDAWRAFAGDRDYKTYIIRTPRGGFHLYYEGELPTSVRRLIPGKPVDTRGKGSYALLPPSATPDGTYAAFLDRPVSPMPEFLTRRVALMRDQSVKLDGPVEWDTVTNLSRATAYLAGRNPAVEGRGGDEHTYQTACDLCDLGISEERAVTLMQDKAVKIGVPDELDTPTALARATAFLTGRAPAKNDILQKALNDYLDQIDSGLLGNSGPHRKR